MMKEIFKYIDRIFAIIRPRRLLYLAIDGVAPRAKMNQQRSRRFRAAQESCEKQEKEAEIKKEMIEKGILEEPPLESEESPSNFDSNCITPGTPFMDLVARSLRYYIHDRINSEPAWQQINVILSDASVPGEGEHKIVDYIRKQRLEPNYDPNQQNVIYGLDADLIMLSMATHESRFHVLREDVFAEDKNRCSSCYNCGKPGHIADKCPGRVRSETPENHVVALSAPKPFIFLQVTILREYLEAELKPQKPVAFTFNLERAIDDWIFLCFFVGNDFLPHLPSLELREGAIDILLKIYKELQGKLGGYSCDGGKVDLNRAQMIMQSLAKVEPTIFEKRQLKEERRIENINRRKLEEREEQSNEHRFPETIPKKQRYQESEVSEPEHKRMRPVIEIVTPQSSGQSNREILEQQRIIREKNIEAARALKANLLDDSLSSTNSSSASLALSGVTSDPEAPIDIVKLWEPGARERYYVSKFNIKPEEVDEFSKKVARSYVEGFCWVLAYYYRGCPSWKWFYPYHYAPFAADLVDIADLKIEFDQGAPFRPFDQLMAVFPAASREHIPNAFHHLMTSHESEIIDFYPEEFSIDMNGKKAAWQGVALLPFIEENRLLEALETAYPGLTEIEKKRNQLGNDIIYTCKNSRLGQWLQESLGEIKMEIPSDLSPGAQVSDSDNFVALGKTFFSHIESLPDVKNILVISAKLFLHCHSLDDYNFNLLAGVISPERQLNESDIYMTRSNISAQNFPNILSYGTGNRHNNSHSMHRDTRDQMRRSDGASIDSYRPNRSGYNRDSYSREGYNRDRRDNRNVNDRDSGRNSYNQNNRPSRGYDNQSSYGSSYDRFSEYGNSNVPGPYDIINPETAPRSNNNTNIRQYNNRYNRR
jgi:5'-3' exoribonuclease 2